MGYKKGLEKYKIFGQLKLTLFGLKKKKKKKKFKQCIKRYECLDPQ